MDDPRITFTDLGNNTAMSTLVIPLVTREQNRGPYSCDVANRMPLTLPNADSSTIFVDVFCESKKVTY